MKNLYQYWSPDQKNLLKYIFLMIYVCTAQGKVGTIYSLEDIKEKAKNNPYLIVFAYKKDLYNANDRLFKQKIERISKAIEKLAEKKEYVMTGVRFAIASADESFWHDLTQNKNSESICFLIFADGNLLQKNNSTASIFKEQGSAGLKDFIDHYLGDEIAHTMKIMEEERQKYTEEDDNHNDQTSTSINVYYPSYYDPYYYNWGYPWYSYGPGWSYGLSWYGYRHRHHYNRSWRGGSHYRSGRHYRGGRRHR